MQSRHHAPKSNVEPTPAVAAQPGRSNAARLDRMRPLREFPHRGAIERALGLALAGRAVVDAEGCDARDVEAFTVGDVVHFATATPDLHTAAHEATHVLQHRGVTSDGGMGPEDHAEQVAEQVARGKSAEVLVGKGPTVAGGEKHATKKTKKKPVAILGYFQQKDQDELVDAVEKADMPKDTPVYMGSYGINESTADAIHGAKGVDGKYAPLFAAVKSKNKTLYAGRDKDAKGGKAYSGAIPTLQSLIDQQKKGKIKSAQYQAYRWGLELGRRFRDQIREANAKGVGVDTWQFDEVWPSASKDTTDAAVSREFLRGAIVGLAKGRPEHEDKLMKGMVHVAHFEALAKLGDKGEMKKFWQSLGECAQYVVGEEYPGFTGGKAGAEKAAAKADAAVDEVRSYGSDGKKVASSYVAGLTPGFRGTSTYGVLGGRAKGQSTKSANDWRDDYVAARAADGVAGFGEYNWMGDSVAQRNDVMDDVGEGLKKA